ncbi:MAG: hypothetical protein WCX73_03710 [Candidatus Pacearchaeota archaeon]|jgi:hypothetical protein
MDKNKIRALFIFEVMGRPAEHLKKALEEYVDQLGKNKGIVITKREVHEPKLIEKEGVDGLFTTFAEVEVIVDSLNHIFEITLNMLPAHVEIIEPDNIILKNFDLSDAMSNLSLKLHKYDEVAKTLAFERNNLLKKMNEMQEKIKNIEGDIKNPEEKEEEKPAKKQKKTKKK